MPRNAAGQAFDSASSATLDRNVHHSDEGRVSQNRGDPSPPQAPVQDDVHQLSFPFCKYQF
ncbi:hypothetical protein [Indibacter alkaliphilus]|uniref:hypothetical protein n=1 Tax=Indibacter alkaliphilus TaxID=579922 RepID=UPI00058DD38D|nr:hypothetical protein [Indibacter alkaliphilus]